MKITFRIKGLDCANCAANLENKIQKVEGVDNASISFMTQKMVIECDETKKEEIVKKIRKVAKKQDDDLILEEV